MTIFKIICKGFLLYITVFAIMVVLAGADSFVDNYGMEHFLFFLLLASVVLVQICKNIYKY